MKKEANIIVCYDGWQIRCDGSDYFYNHDDEMYGAETIKAMLQDLGLKVTIEEAC